MQLNVYVPEARRRLLSLLDAVSRRTGRPKNDLVLDALERYLPSAEEGVELGTYDLGEVCPAPRGELYERRTGGR